LAELNEFSNLGKRPETMKVPYAKKWQRETDKLRQIALDCDLTEELKWGKPCFTFRQKNVAIVIPLKRTRISAASCLPSPFSFRKNFGFQCHLTSL
jgi:uncharacterized protein YdeI (YjbR/CyaY-like superfamily)